MIRLINNINDIKKHVVVSSTLDFNKVLPFCKIAERKLVIDTIGPDQYDSIVIHTYNEDADTPMDQVKNLLEMAVAYYGTLNALPSLNVFISNLGARTAEPTNSTAADWRDKRDLEKAFNKVYTEALDDALQIMEQNVDLFPEFKNSEYYTIFKNLIVSETRIFDKYFPIQKSRPTYLALQSYIQECQDQYLLTMLGQPTLELIKAPSINEFVNKARTEAQKAIVNLTVAKAATAGTFLLKEGMMVASTVALPWELNQQLSQEQRLQLSLDRQNTGEQYLKSLKKIILENPDAFPQYVDKTDSGLGDKIIKKKSLLSL